GAVRPCGREQSGGRGAAGRGNLAEQRGDGAGGRAGAHNLRGGRRAGRRRRRRGQRGGSGGRRLFGASAGSARGSHWVLVGRAGRMVGGPAGKQRVLPQPRGRLSAGGPDGFAESRREKRLGGPRAGRGWTLFELLPD